VLRRISGGWRRLHNEGLHNLYASSNVIRVIKSSKIKCAGHVTCRNEVRNEYNILVQKYERKRQLGRPRHRWGDNIRMDGS
jgi:hypothetical protein